MYKGIVKDALFYLGGLMASPLRFRHKVKKAERNTKWELFCSEGFATNARIYFGAAIPTLNIKH